jgi:hypothetical protein
LTVIASGAKVTWSAKKVERLPSQPFRGTAIDIEIRPGAVIEPEPAMDVF